MHSQHHGAEHAHTLVDTFPSLGNEKVRGANPLSSTPGVTLGPLPVDDEWSNGPHLPAAGSHSGS